MKLFCSFLFLFLHLNGFAQNFEGKLTYLTYLVYHNNTDQIGKINSVLGIDFFEKMDSTVTDYLIKEEQLLSKKYQKDGAIKYMNIQNKDIAYGLLKSGKTMNGSNLPSSTNLKLVKKTKEFKFILGYKCQKYEYKSTRNSKRIVIAWITDKIPFDIEKQSSIFFSKIFFSEGLALEVRNKDKGMESVFSITKIEFYKVDDKEFDIDFPF